MYFFYLVLLTMALLSQITKKNIRKEIVIQDTRYDVMCKCLGFFVCSKKEEVRNSENKILSVMCNWPITLTLSLNCLWIYLYMILIHINRGFFPSLLQSI